MNILDIIKNEKVEWKKLGEVCEVKNGYAFKANLFQEKGYPIIKIANIKKGKIYFGNNQYIRLEDYPNLDSYKVEPNCIVIAMSGATTGKIGFNYSNNTGYLNQRVCKFIPDESKINNRFLFHFLFSKEKDFFELSSGIGAQPNLSNKDIENFLIPIPSLETQEKIAEILDSFEKMYTELQTELQLRNKQYNYYKDLLLSEEKLLELSKNEGSSLEWKSLGEISLSVNNISWKGLSNKKYNYIDLSSIDRKTNKIIETIEIDSENAPSRAQRIVKKDDIIFGTTRPMLRRVTKISEKYDNQICSTGFYVFRSSEKVLPSYIYYIFNLENFYKYIEENQAGVSYPAISDNIMKKLIIPIPPLSIQTYIVSILDSFDSMVNDIRAGLPCEIELRQKQYEYYREKLLNFSGRSENV